MTTKVSIETGEQVITSEDAALSLTSDGGCLRISGYLYSLNYRAKEASMVCETPELYLEDLATLQAVMQRLEALIATTGVFAIEIRVKIDDVAAWAVIGYGESGHPCVLRFEKDAGSRF